MKNSEGLFTGSQMGKASIKLTHRTRNFINPFNARQNALTNASNKLKEMKISQFHSTASSAFYEMIRIRDSSAI